MAIIFVCVAALTACGGPSAIWGILTAADPANTSSDTSALTENGQSATWQATAGMTEALSATGTQATTSPATSAMETSKTSSGSVSDTSAGSSETSGSSTGEPVDCPALDQVQCAASDCMTIMARPLFDDGAGWCIKPLSFLACAVPAACDNELTTACDGQIKYQFNNSCIPAGFMLCAPPPDVGMDGYPECN